MPGDELKNSKVEEEKEAYFTEKHYGGSVAGGLMDQLKNSFVG